MEKIKQFFNDKLQSEKGKDILIVIIVILVGLGSFELGRLSKENSSSGIKILPARAREYTNQDVNQRVNKNANVISATESSSLLQNTKIENSAGKNFFASNRGSKYYTISCSAGKTIKQENRVYFTTGEEAQAAGYKLSSSCN